MFSKTNIAGSVLCTIATANFFAGNIIIGIACIACAVLVASLEG